MTGPPMYGCSKALEHASSARPHRGSSSTPVARCEWRAEMNALVRLWVPAVAVALW
jgi:hypothetical protein